MAVQGLPTNQQHRLPGAKRWRKLLAVSDDPRHSDPAGVVSLGRHLAESMSVDGWVECSVASTSAPPQLPPQYEPDSPDPWPHNRRPECLLRFRWQTEAATEGAPTADFVRDAGLIAGWLVDEFLMLDLVDVSDGSVSRVGFLRRIPSIDRPGFARHWLTRHAPLVVRNGPLFHRYVANIVRPLETGEPFDGIVEQTFATVDDWTEHDRQIREAKPEVKADLGRFIEDVVQFHVTDWSAPVIVK